MRSKSKKQVRHRRSVRFYTTCFGFRSPFKVLCDGTFIHHLLVNQITPADTALSNILGAPVKMFTTRCVLAELKSLGEAYSDSLNVARDLIPARCDHEKRKSAVACLAEVIGEDNSEHFFVASQDADQRKMFQEIPAVPVIFALRNALFLEPPSQSQQQFAKVAEDQRSHMNELEFKMLLNEKKRSSATEEPGDSSVADEALPDSIIEGLKRNTAKRKTDVKDKVQFKRKRAKMRLKKQKRHRRSVRFYTTCFGFRSPFKVLCDGTFIHHLLVNRITPADTALSNILGAPVKMFTTRCVLEELKSLGEAYFDSLNVARDLIPARCNNHTKRKSAVACLAEAIGEDNSEHFFVASQDADLRKEFQEIQAVPVIYALRNALFLEPPSQSQRQFAKVAEDQRSRVNELEENAILDLETVVLD